MKQTIKLLSKVGPDERAFEVSKHSKRLGKVGITLVMGRSTIRTYSESIEEDCDELWRVNSSSIVKVSWNQELAVLSVVYRAQKDKDVATKKYVKVFFVDPTIGKKMIKFYQKVKPSEVNFSPGRPNNTRKRVYLPSSAFKLQLGLEGEKFWSVLETLEGGLMSVEILLGISNTGIRGLHPRTLMVVWKIDRLHLIDISSNSWILLSYLGDIKKHNRTFHRIFHAHPATRTEIVMCFESTFHFNTLEIGEKKIVNKKFELPQSFKARLEEFKNEEVPSLFSINPLDEIPKKGEMKNNNISKSLIRSLSSSEINKDKARRRSKSTKKITSMENKCPTDPVAPKSAVDKKAVIDDIALKKRSMSSGATQLSMRMAAKPSESTKLDTTFHNFENVNLSLRSDQANIYKFSKKKKKEGLTDRTNIKII